MDLRLFSTILIKTCLCLTSAKIQNLNPNRTAIQSEDTLIVRLYPSSIEECLDTCFYNQDCQSVVFSRLTSICDLQSTHESPKEQSDRRGIFVTRNDIEKRRQGQSTANPATRKYTKFCPLSDFAGYKRLGNRNRPGDRVILVNYGRDTTKCTFTTFTCAETGEWLQTDCRNKSTSTATAKLQDCDDIGRAGNPSSGVFEIFPVSTHGPKQVFCDFDDPDGPWTVIQRRVDGTVDFYRNYTEYQAGFGNLSGNFWFGLDKISSISLQDGNNYCLKVTVVDTENGKRFAKYSHFQLTNASTGYRLQVGGYTGDAGDSLTIPHNGQPFSTYDWGLADCAEGYTGAWWYNNCHFSNLNGKYNDTTHGKGVIWKTTTTFDRSATFASMKMKECQLFQ